ncbi:DUF4177 domain-containing protein [Paenibacillus sp. FSL H7-0331]|uniref:DUF4177 domain-containing protein n=1 Tax=Paenibacillus sp. FSL H7-0331 TaxID=1920421 RepID=UPI00096E2BE3|nr:DUF4177 domain-containing protein [Paenibacillus sp. FSL H7-0331]OMF08754.1 hypothetical protein BK127_27820 [Paenibacillus sp. FSL H7-0331]
MEIWEYKTIKFGTDGYLGGVVNTQKYEAQLNSLGADGWELVSVVSSNQHHGASREIVSVLKRTKLTQ